MLMAYKYRLYPTKNQVIMLDKTFGCARFIYNKMLSDKIDYYKETGEMLKNTPAQYKKEFEWLKEVDSLALANSQMNLDKAYKNFFRDKSIGFPKFKSKRKSKMNYTTNNQRDSIRIIGNKIKIPKIGFVKLKQHRLFDGIIKSVTISKSNTYKYFISILVEENSHLELNKNDNKIGIDMGIKDLLITSNGKVYTNKRLTDKYYKKLAKEQRKLSSKIIGSNNWNKQKIKVAKVHEKIANVRKDYLNKISTQLINENQVIICEDLHIKDMVKNSKLAKSILDCSWGEFTRQLKYKSEWYGRVYHEVNRYFPSSQLCNKCGYRNKETKNLSVRFWECPQCGELHDRDINASINILNQGLLELGYI